MKEVRNQKQRWRRTDISDLGDGIRKNTEKVWDSNLPSRQAVVKVNINDQ